MQARVKKRSLVSRIWKSFPVYKFRLGVFYVLDFFAGWAIERRQFRRVHGYPLDLEHPASLSHKLVWKRRFDRNPLLPVIADKFRVRKYLELLIGKERADDLLIPALFVTDKPDEIPFASLPNSFILKATHGSGMNYIVRDLGAEDRKKLVAMCSRWLRRPYGVFDHQWAYQPIHRRILVEKLFLDANGQPPRDYKFFVIHGEVRMIEVDSDRFNGHRVNLYDAQWNLLDVILTFPRLDDCPRPARLEEMVALAGELAQDFDFIRVDFYDIDGKIYFGELTNYPGAGTEKFEPVAFDFELGAHWKIDKDYWKNCPRASDMTVYGK